ncbi:tetratricopeptide repeat protein [Synechocystis sp. PCC 7338]|uniref:CHAT domain-containing tetratricopeptide repeat protein n=1 Tax=Synechocystis sp. PCC 7338 TaxID=2732530 RepID=UPI0020134AAE|nr:tetratricopeptide repeat protein [Synechocystis sp. PCC 7338]
MAINSQFFFLPSPVYSQEKVEIIDSAIGELEAGDLSSDNGVIFDLYPLQLTADQPVLIYLESQDFDPYLILMDGEGNKLAENDDLYDTNAGILIDQIDPQGYGVVVTSNKAGVTGKYKLQIILPDANRLIEIQGHQSLIQAQAMMDEGSKESLFQAIELFTQGVEFYRQIGIVNREIVFALNRLGTIYSDFGENTKALAYYQEAIPLAQQLADSALEGATLNNIGSIYNALADRRTAIDYYQQALVLIRKAGDKTEEMTTINNLGVAYDNLGESEKALQYYAEAVALGKSLNDLKIIGTSLSNIGLAYNNLGEREKALEYYQQALTISRSVGDRQGEAVRLNNIALVYDGFGEKDKALQYYIQSLVIAEAVGDQSLQGSVISNIALVLDGLGQKAQALEYYQQALELARLVGDRSGEGVRLNNIALLYDSVGEKDEALAYYRQALKLAQETGDRLVEGAILSNIGYVYDGLGQLDRAMDYYQQALALRREIKDRDGEALTLNNIGTIYYARGDYGQALNYYEQALSLSRAVKNVGLEATILSNIGYVEFDQKKYDKSTLFLTQAIDLFESINSEDLSDELKVSYFDTYLYNYFRLQESLIAQNQPTVALEIAERGRARALIELLNKRFARDANFIPTEKPTIAALKKIAGDRQSTLVTYALIPTKDLTSPVKLYVYVIAPDGTMEFRQMDFNQDLKDVDFVQLLQTTRQSVTRRSPSDIIARRTAQEASTSLQQLHQILIDPIADLLPSNADAPIIFIPQGPLFGIPFPALQDSNGQYLIDKHTILTAPSIQVLAQTAQQKQRLNRQTLNLGPALVVGNPYPYPDNLNDLENAANEAKQIGQLLGVQPLIGKQAREETVLAQMPQAGVLHFATHASFDEQNGLESAIYLTAELGQSKEDLLSTPGRITAAEIFDHFETNPLHADIAILSACDTGQGEITGDGVIGLSRSLIAAGVPSILVSLWSVDDASTEKLMTEFYQQWQQGGLSKAAALRQAMLQLKQEYPEPYYWGAFTLIGEAE